MEESKTHTKSKNPKASNGNGKKTRTHVPVEGYKIEQLRELPLENLHKNSQKI